MEEFFKINHINVGFADHDAEATGYVKGALNTEILIRKGKLRINLLTPPLEITDEFHNGLLDDPYFDDKRKIDYLRMVTYSDLELESGSYDTQVNCPYLVGVTGFETYNFPTDVKFHGIIDVQEGYVHIKGELKDIYNNNSTIPIEILKCFEAKPILPKRQEYTLKSALNIDPLKVFDLKITLGEFNSLPEQIVTFKNLESLWVGQASFNFDEFPEEFYDLTHLHTLIINNSKIKTISEKIRQFQNLEDFCLSSSNLTVLPDSICELSALTDLDLSQNALTSLPQNIGLMPNLKNLTITYNNFKSLPRSLKNIQSVKADRKDQKLYLDLSYKSKNPKPIDSSIFDFSHYPEEKAALEQAISQIPELAEFKDLIIDYSTVATYLCLNKNQKDLPLGTSKVGGCPDLPKNMEHPKDKNGLLYVFHAQINCEEIAPYQHYLPRQGVIYFFVNDEEYALNPIVLYAADTNELERYTYTKETRFTDSTLDGMFRNSVALSFQNAISIPNFYNSFSYGSERFSKYADLFNNEDNDEKIEILEDFTHVLKGNIKKPVAFDNGHIQLEPHGMNVHIFTQHESPQEQAAQKFGGEPDEWLVLLNMESVDEFSFWDAGTLTYCIHKKDLAINDFSTIHTSIESS